MPSLARASADDLEVCEAGEHRLGTDRRVLERDRDLLVAAGQLGGHHDAVAPSGVADPVPVAELALARDDGTRPDRGGRPGPGSRCGAGPGIEIVVPGTHGPRQRAGPRPSAVRVALR